MRKGAKTTTSDFGIAIGMRKYAYQQRLVGMVNVLETRVSILDGMTRFMVLGRCLAPTEGSHKSVP